MDTRVEKAEEFLAKNYNRIIVTKNYLLIPSFTKDRIKYIVPIGVRPFDEGKCETIRYKGTAVTVFSKAIFGKSTFNSIGCSCPDIQYRHVVCKHMYAIDMFLAKREK